MHCFAYSYIPYRLCVSTVSETQSSVNLPPPFLSPAAALTGPGPGVDVSAIVKAFVRLRTWRLTRWRRPPVHLHTRLSVPHVIVLFLMAESSEVQEMKTKKRTSPAGLQAHTHTRACVHTHTRAHISFHQHTRHVNNLACPHIHLVIKPPPCPAVFFNVFATATAPIHLFDSFTHRSNSSSSY